MGIEYQMFTAAYRNTAVSWFVPPLVIPIAFAITWVGLVIYQTIG